MQLQYAVYASAGFGSGYTGAYVGGGIDLTDFDYVAAGAFDGSAGLPADMTDITSVAQFEAYVPQLLAKTTEISADPVSLVLSNVTGQYLALGGTGADVMTADSSTTAPGFMFGRGGADSLTGGLGSNTLEGGAGDDTLVSGGESDKLVGGPGADHIEINGLAHSDAAHVAALGAGDVLDFSGAAVAIGFATFEEVSHFDGHVAEVRARYHAASDRTVFEFDTNGDRSVDSHVTVRGGDYTDYAHVSGVSQPIAIAPDPHGVVV